MYRLLRGAPLAALLLAGLAPLAEAQTTIDVQLDPMYAAAGLQSGGGRPFIRKNDPRDAPETVVATDFQAAGYAEWVVNTTTPGIYTINVEAMQDYDPNTVLAFETRPLTATTNLQQTRFATRDTKNYGRFGTRWEDPNGVVTQAATYVDLGAMQDADGGTITVPLWAGDNVLRVQSVMGRHNVATDTSPQAMGTGTNRPRGEVWSWLHISGIRLNRVSDMPPMGAISGTVSGNHPGLTTPVPRAIVTANLPGQSPPELVPNWWRNGWYTFTRDDGTYTLMAPVGAMEVKAGRPSGYTPNGSTPAAVTVPATGAVTVNPALTSLWYRNAANNNALTAHLQAEYFDFWTGNIGVHPVDGPPQNGIKMGWVDANESVSLIVDVPEAGNYTVISAYTNGGGVGHYRVSTDLGPSSEGDQPPAGWGTPQTATYPTPIYLVQGTQVITQTNLSGASDFDGVTLVKSSTPATVGLVEGVITNTTSGQPLANAEVRVGTSVVRTDAQGRYRVIANVGQQAVTVNAPYQDAAASGSVNVTSGGTATLNLNIVVRPAIELSTNNGYNWKFLENTGSTANYSAANADETSFQTVVAQGFQVPGNFEGAAPEDSIYAWYRLTFDLPANFLAQSAGRPLVFHVFNNGGLTLDDSDATWLNGTLIGQTGRFPTAPLAPQPEGYQQDNNNGQVTVYPGQFDAPRNERLYFLPANLLKATGNVIAIKIFNGRGGGGIIGMPTLEAWFPTGTITGSVKAGTTNLDAVRVAAIDANGVTVSATMTDASGAFTLNNVRTGATVIAAVKPGYVGDAKAANVVSGGTASGIAFNLAPVAAGTEPRVAPSYDEFTATDWQTRWDAVSLEFNGTANAVAPTVIVPGYDVNQGNSATLPGTITVSGGGGDGERGAIVSKGIFSRYASVSAARLVSSISATYPSGGQPNIIMQLNADPAAYTDPTKLRGTGVPNVELDIEGYAALDNNGVLEPHLRYIVWAHNSGDQTQGAIPGPMTQLSDVSPTNPLDLMIVRAGTHFDFYANNILLHSQNITTAGMTNDHKMALYSFDEFGTLTWDWAKAGPGPITVQPPVQLSMRALRIAGGLEAASTADMTSMNMVNTGASQNKIDVVDAVTLAKQGK